MPGTRSPIPSCSTRASSRGRPARCTIATAGAPDVFVDITDTFDRKIEALRCHVSQHPDPDGLDARIRAWNAANAALGGLPEGRLAESFLRVDTN